MVKRKLGKKETKKNVQLVELFNKYIKECPEMEHALQTHHMNTDKYLYFLSEILRMRKPRFPTNRKKHLKVVSPSSPKAVPGR